jgi:DMSO reductase anchor subunit
MGYTVARKHAAKLRAIVQLAGFVLPMLALILTLTVGGPLILPLTIIGLLAATSGVILERWLFFAEAQHVVTLYYGAEAA